MKKKDVVNKLKPVFIYDFIQWGFSFGAMLLILGLAAEGAKIYLADLNEGTETALAILIVVILAYIFSQSVRKLLK